MTRTRWFTMRLTTAPAAALAVFMAAAAFAADISIKPGDQLIRVEVQTAAQLAQFEAMDLDISEAYGIGPVDVHASIAERAALTAAGMTFRVLNDDLWAEHQRELEQLLRRGDGPYFTTYHNYTEIMAFLNGLVTLRPDLASISSIGRSIESREMWMIRITGPNYTPNRPAVLYHGTQHAREWITSTVVPYLAEHLITQYGVDPRVTRLVDEVEWFLVPVMNPDGFVYSWTPNNRLWRKNRRNNGNGTYGVDLNRNWGYEWGGAGSSGNTSSSTYRGTAPFSEPETQRVRDFILAHPNIQAYIDFHSYSQLILWPWAYTATLCPDEAIYRQLGLEWKDLIFSVHGFEYTAGSVGSTLYLASGGSVDWVYGGAGRWAYTFELRDTGQTGFLLPPEQIIPNNEEILPVALHFAEWLLPPGCPTIPGDMNGDNTLNAADVQGFVDANLTSPFYHPCADLAAPFGVLDLADTAAFVTALLSP